MQERNQNDCQNKQEKKSSLYHHIGSNKKGNINMQKNIFEKHLNISFTHGSLIIDNIQTFLKNLWVI